MVGFLSKMMVIRKDWLGLIQELGIKPNLTIVPSKKRF